MSATALADLARFRVALKARAASAKGAEKSAQPHVDYQHRPEDWIVEKLGIKRETLRWTLSEEYEGHEWDGTRDPLVQLMKELADGTRVIGIESGNGTGKSFIMACLILWFVACWKNARAFTFAPKEDQLTKYIWAEISGVWWQFAREFPMAKLNHLEILIEPGNKLWGAWGQSVGLREGEAVSAKASGMHAEHMMIVTEETQGMDPRVIAANEATCTAEHNIRVALGNPGHPMDELHKICVSPGAAHIRISAEDAPNVVTGRNIVPGGQTRVQVESMKLKHGRDSRFYSTRIRGLCPAGGGPALYELSKGVHLVDLKSLGMPPLDSHLVTRFGWLDWGHSHPWSFGSYACWFDTELGRDRVVKLDTIGGRNMRIDRIAKAIKDEFPDAAAWDYLGTGSDIRQLHAARLPTHIKVKTMQEYLLEEGLHFGGAVDDGPYSRAPRLNNFRQWIAYQAMGPVDPRTGKAADGVPGFVFANTPGNVEAIEQCMSMTTDPKKPENPLKRDADPETGENGDDIFDETMNALASRPYADEPEADSVNENQHPGFEGKAGHRKRKPRRPRDEDDQDDDSPWSKGFSFGADDDEDDEGDDDWWRRS